jgi:hypothetical protein
MSAVFKSRNEMVDDLIEYELGIIRSMSLDDLDDWIADTLRKGVMGYEQFSDEELALMYAGLLSSRDDDISEMGVDDE